MIAARAALVITEIQRRQESRPIVPVRVNDTRALPGFPITEIQLGPAGVPDKVNERTAARYPITESGTIIALVGTVRKLTAVDWYLFC